MTVVQFNAAQVKLDSNINVTVADTSANLQANLTALLANTKADALDSIDGVKLNLTAAQALLAANMAKLQSADVVNVAISATDVLTATQATQLYSNAKIDSVTNLFTLSSASAMVAEGNALAFTVTAQIPVKVATTFNFAVLPDGSVYQAIDTSDVGVLSGTVTIAAGAKTGTFSINAAADSKLEFNEGAKVLLTYAATDSSTAMVEGASVTAAKSFVIQDTAVTVTPPTTTVVTTLTANAVDDLMGDAGNNVFRAEVSNSNNISATNTLTAGDHVDGSAGVDKLVLTATDTSPTSNVEVTGFQLDNVEELDIRAFDMDGVKNNSSEVDLGLMNVDASLIKISSTKSTADINIDYIDHLVALNLIGNSKTGTAVTVNYDSDVTDTDVDTGTPVQTQVVSLNNFGKVNSHADITVDGVEKFELHTANKASVVDVHSDALQAIDLDLAVNLTLGLATVISGLTSITGASSMTGGLTADASASSNALNVLTGEGVDVINTGFGDDTVDAGNGDNVISVDFGDNTVSTGTGSDDITAGDSNSLNRINAGDGDNKIVTGDGNDSVTSGSGNDTIEAGGSTYFDATNTGNVIRAGDGNNTITTTYGNDNISAGKGDDNINVGNDGNIVNAGDGNNTVTGGLNTDRINTGSGNDVIDAGDGNNTVTAGTGNNTVTIGIGSNRVTTLDGADTIIVNGALNLNTISGGAGTDTINVASLNANSFNSFANVSSIETIMFTDLLTGAFTLDASKGANTAGLTTYSFGYDAGEGFPVGGLNNANVNLNNVVNGATVNLNTVQNSTLTVSHLTDTATDALTINAMHAVVLNSLTVAQTETLNLSGAGIRINSIVGSKLTAVNASKNTGDVTLSIEGVNQAATITGGNGKDNFTGGNGNDSISGGAGNDTLQGSTGNDTLDGGADNDTLIANISGATIDSIVGGAGDDTFQLSYEVGANSENLLLNGGDGTDTVQLGGDITSTSNDKYYTHWDSIETLDVSDIDGIISNDNVKLNGAAMSAGINKVTTGSGNDTVSASELFVNPLTVELKAGNDSIVTSTKAALTVKANATDITAADTLTGSNNADTLQLYADNGVATLANVTKFETILVTGEMNPVADANGQFNEFGDSPIVDKKLGNESAGELDNTYTDNHASITIANDKVIATGKLLTVDASALIDKDSYLVFDGTAETDKFSITGSAGNDTLKVGNGNNSVSAGEGSNTILTGTGNDTISSGSGADNIDASAGNNSINAGDGNNNVIAGTGNDTIKAGTGSDVITGGAGTDAMTGGSGNDTFVIKGVKGSVANTFVSDSAITTAAADSISDFVTGLDKLALGTDAIVSTSALANYSEGVVVSANYDAAIASANIALNSLATANTDVIEGYNFQWDSSNGYLFNDIDGNGTADQMIILVGVTATGIAAGDIIA